MADPDPICLVCSKPILPHQPLMKCSHPGCTVQFHALCARDYAKNMSWASHVYCHDHEPDTASGPALGGFLLGPPPKSGGVIKDSGTRRTFDTGSVRDAAGREGRYDLLPHLALFCLARHFEEGAIKYGDDNWRLGQPIKAAYLDSACRHLHRFLAGDRDEPHLTAAAWNILCAVETIILVHRGDLPLSLLDLPPVTNEYIEPPDPPKPEAKP